MFNLIRNFETTTKERFFFNLLDWERYKKQKFLQRCKEMNTLIYCWVENKWI